MFEKIFGIRQMCELYDVLVFDLWGVFIIHNKINQLLVDFFNNELQGRKQVFFLSNTSRTSDACCEMLMQWGLEKLTPSQIITAGDIAKDAMLMLRNPIVYHINDNMNDASIIEGMHTTTNLDQANILLLSLFQENHEQLHIFDDILKHAIELKTINICANPDMYTIGSKNAIRYNAGYFAKKLEQFGGIVHYAGKPHQAIFRKLLSSIIKSADNVDVDLNKIVMIGDTLEQDILGALQVGISSALVINGNSCADCKTLETISEKIYARSIIPSLLVDVSKL
ncbi:HAD superfamily hydrolase [Rickettsiales endosymbiont of Paramecium tredecaurelia]|uniref:TIGR01459 family HAD-type hydrolase n=1 Tax=Candidatus Sarmatiella mevalonica TaxID=2770581 RepID=UPI001922345C|nr:TIGR01459 family HAD-type hydrolase [Candidatus Sarmatiella mevalonica]MBL3284682.1 HAD superfamily hydrolase [Candidatus Sarmatiella mevalonica]